ncbi:ABC transporter ATP-binding protein [Aestuariivirga sp.]|uniref:ABC transporter ATP-binding protein n=1 Tax=Aestuariivirga sp. TaxID=2650926 RepID=UPI00359488DF
MAAEGQAPFIRIEGVSKSFGKFTAVNDVSLDIMKGEMFALLGGSGCGKTTLLRMLAGFEQPSSGRIFLDGQDMSGIPPYERPVNMMFQSYALFPHMTVEGNVGYGLKHEKMTAAERTGRVRQMLDLVQLTALAERKPHQLSGGQRQRVALARALAKQPKLLLLDEPLGALDKKLREHTQFEIMNIQERTGITFVVVTHDQEEAMTLADRIAVMDHGEIRQVGAPTEVYEHPSSRFVAGFIGSINMFDGDVKHNGAGLTIAVPSLGSDIVIETGSAQSGDKVTVAVRPEKIMISRDRPECANAFQGVVKDLGYFGKDSLYRVVLPSGTLVSVNSVNTTRGSGSRVAEWDDKVWLSFEPSAAILLRD